MGNCIFFPRARDRDFPDFTILKRHQFLILYFHLKFGPVKNREFENGQKQCTLLRCRKVWKSALLLQQDRLIVGENAQRFKPQFWQLFVQFLLANSWKSKKVATFPFRGTIARFRHKNDLRFRAIVVAAKFSTVTILRFELL
jgi:hypothetical protein